MEFRGGRKLAMKKLGERAHQPDDPFCDHEDCQISHKILGEYDVPYKTRKVRLMVTASNDPQHDCHGCGPSLSLFEFTARDGRWELTDSQFAVIEWGEFGEAASSGVSVALLSDDVYGIFLASSSIHQGMIEEFTNVLASVHGAMKPVAQIQTGENTEGAPQMAGNADWSGTVTVAPKTWATPAGFRDLIVKITGIDSGKKADRVQRYRFNGTEYWPWSRVRAGWETEEYQVR